MGLSGRKTKQRIGTDPRNLTWSDDSSKFGAKYLQSLGWTSGTGLGASGEGRVSNLKIHQKLDLLGIGGNKRAPGGDEAGWKGSREFEGLLARLNQGGNENANGDENRSALVAVEDTQIVTVVDERIEDHAKAASKNGEDIKKKRKRSTMDDEENNAKETKRKRKEDRELKKEKKKADKAAKKLKATKNHSSESSKPAGACTDTSTSPRSTKNKPIPLFRAHRARHLASKRMAAASATSMNEILGISSCIASSDLSTSLPKQDSSFGTSNTDGRVSQETNDTPHQNPTGLGSFSSFGGGLGFRGSRDETQKKSSEAPDLLRKSGKSVADYFSEKLLLKTRKAKVVESAVLGDS